jgi:O-antigen/teichoic acid export membrane protein
MNKYLKATSYNLVFFIINSLAFLILTPLAIRIMGDEFFGLWSIIFGITQFANIGTLGIGAIVTKFASEVGNKLDASRIITSAIFIVLPMAILTSGILICNRNALAVNINPSPNYVNQLVVALVICAFTILPQFISKVFQGYFLSQLESKFVRTMEFISSVFPLAGGIVISLVERNLVWISLWNLFTQFGILFISIFSASKSVKLKWSPNTGIIKRMISFSAFMFLGSSASIIFQQLDRVLVGMSLGPSAAGVYAVGTSVGSRLAVISGHGTESMIPYASQKNSLGEKEMLYRAYRTLVKYNSLMIESLASLAIMWMYEILAIWISPEYSTEYSYYFSLLILAYGIFSLSRPAYQTLTGLGYVKLTSYIYLVASVAMILSLFFLSRRYGLFGATLANLIMASLLTMNLYAYKIFDKKNYWRHFIADLKWGVIFPSISYIVILFQVPTIYRIGVSLCLGGFVVVTISRDTYFRGQILQVIRGRIIDREEQK